ncbi:ribbon-helix-helix protein, CopG family [Streptomyces sp. SYSU K217416]
MIHRIRVRMHESEWQLLREICEEQRRSVTQVMRAAIRLYAAERPQDRT